MNEHYNVGGKKQKPAAHRVARVLRKKKWTNIPLHSWQVDGKEQVPIADGSQRSWVDIADEATGSHLKAIVYEQRVVASINLQAMIWDFNETFGVWGLPVVLKIDNGRPLVNPDARDVPTLAILWWIGLGIKVIQNTPGRPQENGMVECIHGTIKTWAVPHLQVDTEALQKSLDEESDFQRNHYQLPKKNRQTRIQLFPELLTNERKYNPDLFDIQKVYDHLKNFVWERRVKNSGEVSIFGHAIYIGQKYAKELITVTIDPIEHQWEFRKFDGTLLKLSQKGVPNEKEIKDFAIMSKNEETT